MLSSVQQVTDSKKWTTTGESRPVSVRPKPTGGHLVLKTMPNKHGVTFKGQWPHTKERMSAEQETKGKKDDWISWKKTVSYHGESVYFIPEKRNIQVFLVCIIQKWYMYTVN